MTAAMLLLLMMVHYKRVGTRNDLFARWRVWEIWVCANNKEHTYSLHWPDRDVE